MKTLISLIMCVSTLFSFGGCGSEPQLEANTWNETNYTEEEYGQIIDSIKEFQSTLKDPTSLRIYGDALIVKIKQPNGAYENTISLNVDAKNGFGAYNGQTEYTIGLKRNSYNFSHMLTSKDRNYKSHFGMYAGTNYNLYKEQLSEKGYELETFMISGEKISNDLGCEYI